MSMTTGTDTQNRKKILIVEDNIINRRILSKILEDEYIILEAGNGKEALDILEYAWEEISLILLDLIMPVMDGYTFMSKVKDITHLASIPIIVTTSNDSEKDEVSALKSGATDFIRKPYHWQIVKHRIRSIITLRETASVVNLIMYDQLTGLYSKEYFYKIAEDEIHSNPDKQYDIVCCDIEGFSTINDTFGYEKGNEILQIMASVLKTHIPDVLMCSRMNSDVFILLLKHRDEYDAPFFMPCIDEVNSRASLGKITIDFGIYPISDLETTIYTACNRALAVIEKVKGQFTTNFAVYDEQFAKDKAFAQQITNMMEQSLADREFVVYYQPKWDLLTNAMIGAEALVRWISPVYGFMSPGLFIPLFEKNGFITELDRYVWETACEFLKKSKDMGLPSLPVSVNISRTDLDAMDVPKVLTSLIAKYGLSPSDLHLEITESAYTDYPELLLDITRQLHELGFILEMDDFGTGYSSLNMLSEMTLDVLKLDMKFAQSQKDNIKMNTILSFILDLAKRMQLTVISEGVETREQAETLRDMGCNQAQGYYFAKPIEEKEYIKLLKNMQETTASDTSSRTIFSETGRTTKSERHGYIYEFN